MSFQENKALTASSQALKHIAELEKSEGFNEYYLRRLWDQVNQITELILDNDVISVVEREALRQKRKGILFAIDLIKNEKPSHKSCVKNIQLKHGDS